MKKLSILGAFVAFALILSSCGSVEKILPKKDGTWKIVTETTREFIANTLDTTYTLSNIGTLVFEKDGVGTLTDVDSTYAITWAVSGDDDDIVTICQDFFGASVCFPFDVLESSKDAQNWMTTFDAGGGDYEEIEWALERQ